jgi:hypothetical protein
VYTVKQFLFPRQKATIIWRYIRREIQKNKGKQCRSLPSPFIDTSAHIWYSNSEWTEPHVTRTLVFAVVMTILNKAGNQSSERPGKKETARGGRELNPHQIRQSSRLLRCHHPYNVHPPIHHPGAPPPRRVGAIRGGKRCARRDGTNEPRTRRTESSGAFFVKAGVVVVCLYLTFGYVTFFSPSRILLFQY